MAANKKNRKCSNGLVIAIIMLSCLCLFTTYVYFKIERIKQQKSKYQRQSIEPSIFERLKQFFTSTERQNSKPKQSNSNVATIQELLPLVKEDIYWIYVLVVSGLCYLIPREPSSIVAGFVLLVTAALTYFYSHKLKTKKKNKTKKEEKGAISLFYHIRSIAKTVKGLSYAKLAGICLSFAFVISIPWEFVRLYQIEVAKRAALMQTGTPAECMPSEMSLQQSIRYWFRLKFSWQLDPCEKYHRALLVDPLWETSPLMVISSAITRCLLYPLELFFAGVGKCFRLFFSEIPAQWQPVLLVVMTVILILVLVMHCGYRLHLPFFLKFEPKTPVIVRLSNTSKSEREVVDVGKGDHLKSAPEKKKLTYTEDSQQSPKSS